jgi:hypothetical protein
VSERGLPALSRRRAIAAGTAVLLTTATATSARAAAPSGVEQLERLLALEHRLEAAYETALARDAIEPRLGETLLSHEREHVRGLEQSLRGHGSPRAGVPPPGAGTAFAGRAAFARHALALEAEALAAYQDVLATLRNERLLLPLAAIMAAGAQHQVALRQAADDDLLAR